MPLSLSLLVEVRISNLRNAKSDYMMYNVQKFGCKEINYFVNVNNASSQIENCELTSALKYDLSEPKLDYLYNYL